MAAGRLQTTSVGKRRLILVGSLVRLLGAQQPASTTAEITEAPMPKHQKHINTKAQNRRVSQVAGAR